MEVTVTYLSGAREGQMVVLRNLPLKLGRDRECEVRFDPREDRKVSARHAEVREAEQGGLEVTDLGSRNGVLVDGKPIDGSAVLRSGAVVELGAGGPKLRIAFESGGGGGISFSQVRRELERKHNPSDIRPLVSTEDDLNAFTGPVAPPQRMSGVDGRVVVGALLVIIGLGALLAVLVF